MFARLLPHRSSIVSDRCGNSFETCHLSKSILAFTSIWSQALQRCPLVLSLVAVTVFSL